MTTSLKLTLLRGPNAGFDEFASKHRIFVPGPSSTTFGREHKEADLWCGDPLGTGWISAIAGRFTHRNGLWWLENPVEVPSPDEATAIADETGKTPEEVISAALAKANLRYVTGDETTEIMVAAAGSAPLPPGNGTLTIIGPRQKPILIQVNQANAHAPNPAASAIDYGDAGRDVPFRMRGTRPLRPDSEVVIDTLAVMTWPLRKQAAFRCLSTAEAAQHMDLSEDTIGTRLRRYRAELVETYGWTELSSGHPEELCNIAVDFGFIFDADDDRVFDKWGEPKIGKNQ